MSLYDKLNIKKDATPEEVKKAYRKKAKESHPDKQGGDAEEMQELNKAYAVLKNPYRRERYDKFGEENTVDNDNVKMTQIICEVVVSLIQNNPKIIKQSLGRLKAEWERNYSSGKANIEKEMKALEEFKTRILVHPENNIIEGFIDGKIGVFTNQLQDIEKDYELRLKALGVLLDDYVYSDIKETDPWEINARAMGYTITTAG